MKVVAGEVDSVHLAVADFDAVEIANERTVAPVLSDEREEAMLDLV